MLRLKRKLRIILVLELAAYMVIFFILGWLVALI
jgi:hypothetical protein